MRSTLCVVSSGTNFSGRTRNWILSTAGQDTHGVSRRDIASWRDFLLPRKNPFELWLAERSRWLPRKKCQYLKACALTQGWCKLQRVKERNGKGQLRCDWSKNRITSLFYRAFAWFSFPESVFREWFSRLQWKVSYDVYNIHFTFYIYI